MESDSLYSTNLSSSQKLHEFPFKSFMSFLLWVSFHGLHEFPFCRISLRKEKNLKLLLPVYQENRYCRFFFLKGHTSCDAVSMNSLKEWMSRSGAPYPANVNLNQNWIPIWLFYFTKDPTFQFLDPDSKMMWLQPDGCNQSHLNYILKIFYIYKVLENVSLRLFRERISIVWKSDLKQPNVKTPLQSSG